MRVGFRKKTHKLIDELKAQNPLILRVLKMERKKNALLIKVTLRSQQNDCARFFPVPSVPMKR